MDMYLLLNSFEAFCDEYEDFPQLAMVVYYKLVNRFNRRGWPELLACSNQRMMLACRIKDEETYIKHRNLLKQHGFIDFTSGKKGSPTKYKLLLNTRFNRGISPSNVPSISPSETPSKSPVTKRNTIKLKTKDNILAREEQLILLLSQLVNRPLGSRDQQVIGAWLDDGVDTLVAVEAVKKAIVQNADAPIIYADKIVIDWDKRGLKTIGAVLEFLKQEKKLSKREQDDIERRRLTEEYDRKYGEQNDSAMQSKLPSVLRY